MIGVRTYPYRSKAQIEFHYVDGIERVGKNPSLTTVQIPFREIGITGAERLAARLRKRFHGKQHIYISGKLRVGTTVAAPR